MPKRRTFDFSGLTNPKRVIDRREREAEEGYSAEQPSSAQSQPSEGTMSQSEFFYGTEGMRRKKKDK